MTPTTGTERGAPNAGVTPVTHAKVRKVRDVMPRMTGTPQEVALDVLTILGLEDVR